MKYISHLFLFKFFAEHLRVNYRDQDPKYLNTSHVPPKRKDIFLHNQSLRIKFGELALLSLLIAPKLPLIATVIAPEFRSQPSITPGTEMSNTEPSGGRLSYAGLSVDSEPSSLALDGGEQYFQQRKRLPVCPRGDTPSAPELRGIQGLWMMLQRQANTETLGWKILVLGPHSVVPQFAKRRFTA